MRKYLNNPWIVAALALLAVAFVSYSIWPKTHRDTGVASAEPSSLAQADPPESQSLTGDVSAQSIDGALKAIALTSIPTDPFVSKIKRDDVAVTEQLSMPDVVETMKLSAIWSQEGKTFVLVNGQVHQAGDEISRIKIESATQEGMWVGHWKGRTFVTLGSDFTLVTPAKMEQRTARL